MVDIKNSWILKSFLDNHNIFETYIFKFKPLKNRSLYLLLVEFKYFLLKKFKKKQYYYLWFLQA